MFIEVLGKSRKLSIKDTKESVEWFLTKLCGNAAEPIELTVSYKYKLRKKSGGYAFMDWLDKPVRPEIFEIEIDAELCQIDTLKTLAHECVHIKQYRLGELRDFVRQPVEGSVRKWHGKLYNLADDGIYYDLPWEIDARGREEGLVDRLLAVYTPSK